MLTDYESLMSTGAKFWTGPNPRVSSRTTKIITRQLYEVIPASLGMAEDHIICAGTIYTLDGRLHSVDRGSCVTGGALYILANHGRPAMTNGPSFFFCGRELAGARTSAEFYHDEAGYLPVIITDGPALTIKMTHADSQLNYYFYFDEKRKVVEAVCEHIPKGDPAGMTIKSARCAGSFVNHPGITHYIGLTSPTLHRIHDLIDRIDVLYEELAGCGSEYFTTNTPIKSTAGYVEGLIAGYFIDVAWKLRDIFTRPGR